MILDEILSIIDRNMNNLKDELIQHFDKSNDEETKLKEMQKALLQQIKKAKHQ